MTRLIGLTIFALQLIQCIHATNQTYDFTDIIHQHNNHITLQSHAMYNQCDQNIITLTYRKSVETFGNVETITEVESSPLFTTNFSTSSIDYLEQITSHSINPVSLSLQRISSLDTIQCVPSVQLIEAANNVNGSLWFNQPLFLGPSDITTQSVGIAVSFRLSQQSRTCVTKQMISQSTNTSTLHDVICDDQFTISDRVFNQTITDSVNQPKHVATGGDILSIVLSRNQQSNNQSITIELSAYDGISAWLTSSTDRYQLTSYGYSLSADDQSNLLRDNEIHQISIVIYPSVRQDLVSKFTWNGKLNPSTMNQLLQHPISSCCVYFDVAATIEDIVNANPLFCLPISLQHVLLLNNQSLFVGLLASNKPDKYQQVDIFNVKTWDV